MNELVSASIEQEDACRARLEEERKKRPLPGLNGGAPPKYCLVYTPPPGQPHGPPSSLSYPGSKKHRTEASIRVPMMFNHTHSNNMINR
jgi:hypothetical protein